jgi:hypothetical protein
VVGYAEAFGVDGRHRVAEKHDLLGAVQADQAGE